MLGLAFGLLSLSPEFAARGLARKWATPSTRGVAAEEPEETVATLERMLSPYTLTRDDE